MSTRQDKEREAELEPKRMEYSIKTLHAAGIKSVFVNTEKSIQFNHKGNTITFWAYSGWASGKGIVAGRGLANLIKQITP